MKAGSLFDFTYSLNNKEEQIKQETIGNLTVSGDKYKLNYLGAIQLFDGEKTYTIVPENEEITIIKSNDQEEEDLISDTWYHLVLVKNDINYSLYLDGDLEISIDIHASADYDYISAFRLGSIGGSE